ncbi:MAG: DASS family sodium-coupled anion symporter [Bacteroidota bacterium]
MNKSLKLILCSLIPIVILLIPRTSVPLEGITEIEQRVIAIFFFAAIFWIAEPIPVYTTSLLIIFFELVLLSEKGLIFLRNEGEAFYGQAVGYKDILHTFASPIIILFLGGFFLAMAATKYRLDQNLARVLLAPFGAQPRYVMLGLMSITAVFSMFMSNTATTAMMLSILAPVLAVFEMNDKGKIAFALAIPLAANVGGIGTPIGTPPNAVALKYLTGDNVISFGEWMMFAVPFVIVLLFIGWFVLMAIYPSQTKTIQLDIKGKFLKNPKAYVVYATFSITIILWLTDFIHGMNSYVVAMLPVAVFSATGIINKKDLQLVSWDVLWLVSGGIALGLALDKSGLASRVIGAIPFEGFSPLLIVLAVSVVAAVMANFMSNTATANLLLPLVAVLGTSISSLNAYGGTQMVIVATTIACSMGMALPISTPPNALAFGTGLFETKQMAKPGVAMAIIGLLLSYGLLFILQTIGFFT